MAESNRETAQLSEADGLLAAIRRIFRPLVRLLISRSIPFPTASAVLRAIYVDVAVDEFPVAGKPQTDSRVTLLTGVHRKDVKRLRSERHDTSRPPRAVSFGTQLIARWLGDPAYQDAAGVPVPLPRLSATDGPSFDGLVRSLSSDIRSRVVLDEWLRLGLVHLDDDDRVCLDVQGFIPASGTDEMAYFFGRNVHDHLAAAVHNMLGGSPPLLERSVSYNHLSPAAVAELTAVARTQGSALLRELNARAHALQQRDAGRADATHRFTTGVYVFTEPPPPGDVTEHAAAPPSPTREPASNPETAGARPPTAGPPKGGTS